MATPAVSGVAALLYSAAPEWKNYPVETAELLRKKAVPIETADCAPPWGQPSDYPNCVYGFGEIDAYAAVLEGLNLVTKPASAATSMTRPTPRMTSTSGQKPR
jgi:subtilisin family serine protease